MSRITPRWRGRSLLAASAMLAFLAGPAAAGAMAHQESLYTQTNDPAGNVVQRFDRGARGAPLAGRDVRDRRGRPRHARRPPGRGRPER